MTAESGNLGRCIKRVAFAVLTAVSFGPVSSAWASDISFDEGNRSSQNSASMSLDSYERTLKVFLWEKFSRQGISIDLVDIIVSRIHSFAIGEERDQNDNIGYRLTSYPSVVTQLLWQRKLDVIANQYARNLRPIGQHVIHDVIIGDKVRKKPNKPEIEWYVVKSIREDQGAFGQAISQSRFNQKWVHVAPPRVLPYFPKFKSTTTVRISGISTVDNTVKANISELNSGKYGHSVSIVYVGAAEPTNVEIIIPQKKYGASSVSYVLLCFISTNCKNLDSLAEPSSAINTREIKSSRQGFLESLYLTNPYGPRRAGNGVISFNKGNSLKLYCSLEDIVSKISGSMELVDAELLHSCLKPVF